MTRVRGRRQALLVRDRQREQDARELARLLERVLAAIVNEVAGKLAVRVKAAPSRSLTADVQRIVSSRVLALFGRRAQAAASEQGLSLTQSVTTTRAASEFVQRLRTLSDVIRRTVDVRGDEILARVLSEREGLSRRQVRDELTSRLTTQFDADRAITWARTEVAVAEDTATVAAYEAARVQRIEWIAFASPVWPRRHDLLDGAQVELGDYFEMPRSSHRLRWPHDPLGHVSEVVNCRCATRAVVRRRR